MAKSPIMETFIANLKLALVSAGMTQKDLSEKTGMHQSNISRVTVAEDAWLSTLYTLAEGVGYPVWELLRPDFQPSRKKPRTKKTSSV